MADIKDVLAQLRANKVKRHNHVGATRRIFGTTVRKSKYASEDLGKKVGYCPNCNLVQGEKCLDSDCRRCGERIDKGTIKKHSDPTNHMIWSRPDTWGNSEIKASCHMLGSVI